MAAAFAAGARARGRTVVLAETDTHGGGIDVHLGIERQPGPRWPDLLAPGDPAVVPDDLPRWRGIGVLGADRLRPVPANADGGERTGVVLDELADRADLLVLDLGRVPAPGAPGAIDRCAGVLLVVPRDVRGVAGAIAAQTTLEGRGRLGVLDRAGGPLGRLEVTEALGVTGWGTIPVDRGLPDAVERGDGPPVGSRDRLGRWAADALENGPIAALAGTRP